MPRSSRYICYHLKIPIRGWMGRLRIPALCPSARGQHEQLAQAGSRGDPASELNFTDDSSRSDVANRALLPRP
eukprot:569546-Rhodomonas_salina.2